MYCLGAERRRGLTAGGSITATRYFWDRYERTLYPDGHGVYQWPMAAGPLIPLAASSAGAARGARRRPVGALAAAAAGSRAGAAVCYNHRCASVH